MLQELSDTLSAPRRALWRALGGPETGEELVSNLTGMDRDSWLTKGLGVGAEILGDPLTYAIPFGAGALTRALSGGTKATKGLLGAKPVSGFFGSEATGVADAAASNLAAGSGMKPLLEKVTSYKNVQSIPREDAISALDHLAQGGKFGPREAISSIHPGPDDSLGWIGKIKNPGVVEDPNHNLGRVILGMQKQTGDEALEGAAGFYSPLRNTRVTLEGSEPYLTSRHEGIHALIDQAAKAGTTEGLPSWLMKIPAALKMGGAERGTFRHGLGKITDELAAQTLENKGVLNQLRGAGNFLFGPDQGYLQGYLANNRPSGELYRALLGTGQFARGQSGGVTPLMAGALSAGGLGAGLLGSYLSD